MPNYLAGDAWKAAHPKNGRPLGTRNSLKQEAKDFAREVLSSEEYRRNLQARANAGTLSPQMEVLLWSWAFGPVPKQVEVRHVADDLSALTTAQLLERAEEAVAMLREADALEAAINAEYELTENGVSVLEGSSPKAETGIDPTGKVSEPNQILQREDGDLNSRTGL